MGMYDHVKCRIMSCPGCGGDLDWQTKDGDCLLERVYVVDLMRDRNEMRMVGDCDKCHWYIEVAIERDTGLTAGQHLARMRERDGVVPEVEADEARRFGEREADR